VAARSEWVCGRSLAGIVGSNPARDIDLSILWLLCVVRQRSLRQVDYSSRGVVCVAGVIVKPRWWCPSLLRAVAPRQEKFKRSPTQSVRYTLSVAMSYSSHSQLHHPHTLAVECQVFTSHDAVQTEQMNPKMSASMNHKCVNRRPETSKNFSGRTPLT
jgi:hypothetical protein